MVMIKLIIKTGTAALLDDYIYKTPRCITKFSPSLVSTNPNRITLPYCIAEYGYMAITDGVNDFSVIHDFDTDIIINSIVRKINMKQIHVGCHI